MSVRITKDGRRILSGKDYTEFRQDLHSRQSGNCAECGKVTSLTAPIESDWSFHTDHTKGRGGGKRDDTFEACKGLCGSCHRNKHNQGRSS